jgi:hypothetical protein
MQRLLAWSSRMKIIPPNLTAPESIDGQTVGETLVHRRIEIMYVDCGYNIMGF